MAKTKPRDVAPARYAPAELQAPMRGLVGRLRARGFDLSGCRALEFFAREGNWQAVSYADQVRAIDAWEIDPRFERALRRNLPHARIRIGDSFDLARQKEFAGKFDLIVMDNPQGIYGDQGQYCEHFEALELVPRLIRQEAVVIFDINRKPFNYHRFPEWRKRRERFYRRRLSARLGEEFLLRFYRRYFERRGLTVRWLFLHPRHEYYFLYGAVMLKKRSAR